MNDQEATDALIRVGIAQMTDMLEQITETRRLWNRGHIHSPEAMRRIDLILSGGRG